MVLTSAAAQDLGRVRVAQGQHVADDDFERPLDSPMLVLCPECYGPFAPIFRHPARNDASISIKLEALGQTGGREADRPCPMPYRLAA